MTPEQKTLRSLFGIIFLDLTYLTLTYPLITLIFFDTQSRLFPTNMSFAERSMWYGFCVSLPNIINIFFAPLLSALSDEFGRKKILLLEILRTLFFALTVGLGIYAGSLALVLLGFAIKGAYARPSPTPLAIIGDVAPKQKKVVYMGYLQCATSIGASVGPILGGYFATRFMFAQLNFSLPFFIGAGLALLNIFLSLFLIRETLKKRNTPAWSQFNMTAFKQILAHPDIRRLSLILFFIQISWSTYYQFMPPILKTVYHFDSHQLGWFIGMIAVWLAVATGMCIRILHHFLSVRQLLLVSLYLILAGLIITLLGFAHIFSGNTLLWMGAAPTAMGDVIAYSCLIALYSNVLEREKQGKVMGISFLVAACAWTTTGFLGGILMSMSPLLPLIVAPAGIFATLIFIHVDTTQPFGEDLRSDSGSLRPSDTSQGHYHGADMERATK